MKNSLKFLSLFAGGGGLSEGFIQAGFEPIAHIEKDRAACFTLQTRMAYHWLKRRDQLESYRNYLKGKLSRKDLYSKVPAKLIRSVINEEIGNCLLYTSPSPRDRQKSRMPSSA